MPEYYLFRTFLSDDQEAVAHVLKDDPTSMSPEKSIVRIQKREMKAEKQETQTFEIEYAEISSMHYIREKNVLAIAVDGSCIIRIYNLTLGTMDEINRSSSPVQSMTATEKYLIVGKAGSLCVYDQHTCIHKVKLGNSISGLTVSDDFILCDVFTKENYSHQVKLFHLDLGEKKLQFLRNVGPMRIQPFIKTCFLGFLEEATFFVGIPKKETCEFFIYDAQTGIERNHFEIPSSDAMFVSPLLQGSIAVRCVKKSNSTISVYDALTSILTFSTVSDCDLIYREDMLLFVAGKISLRTQSKGLVDALTQFGIFPPGVTHIIRDYAVSFQAMLEEKATEKKMMKS